MLEAVDEVTDAERVVLAVREWLPVELADEWVKEPEEALMDERVREPEEVLMDELMEPELTLADKEALAVPLSVALAEEPEKVLVRLAGPELDMVELHETVPEDVLAETLAEMVTDEGRLWEALEPERDAVKLPDALPEDVLPEMLADEGRL